ncbi:FAD-dependent oxidoreductase [Streptomyces sp. M10(2022)]
MTLRPPSRHVRSVRTVPVSGTRTVAEDIRTVCWAAHTTQTQGGSMSAGRRELDSEHDVVVVGSGAGAMTGAYLAASAGLSTVVLERTELLGGTSAYSGAACWLPGSQVQERAGIGDSTELARNYLRALLGDRERDRQEAFLRHAPELVARLEQDPALEFEWRAFPDYAEAPDAWRRAAPSFRSTCGRTAWRAPAAHTARGRPGPDRRRAPGRTLTAGRALIGRLLLALTGTGNGRVRTGIRVRRLLTDDGRVTGVEGTVPTASSGCGPAAESCWPPAASRAMPGCARNTGSQGARSGRWPRAAPIPETRSSPPSRRERTRH